MSQFSGVLQLSDLNDYMGPSTACIKPQLDASKNAANAKKALANDNNSNQVDRNGVGNAPVRKAARVLIEADVDTSSSGMPPEKASITLQDCLACSGCVTSAETVLITAQSGAEFKRILEQRRTSRNMKVVVSIAPQSRASLAAHFNLSATECNGKLVTILREMGVDEVFDIEFAREIALSECANEFIRAKQCAMEKTEHNGPKLPILSSACPGWICYAEKSNGALLIPHIATVKSPQQVMGSFVKHFWAKEHSLAPSDVFHISIMPCYDKKLEASRDEFYSDIFSTRDVDCVLSSGEVLELIAEQNITMTDVSVCAQEQPYGYTRTHNRGVSGGYAEYVFAQCAQQLFGVVVEEVEFKQQRNRDFHVASLTVDGKTVLKVAKMNGFRNIQSIIRKLKGKKIDFDYVEVMACPSGCINGGGQIRVDMSAVDKSAGGDGDGVLTHATQKQQQQQLDDVTRVYMEQQTQQQQGEQQHQQEGIDDLCVQWLGESDANATTTPPPTTNDTHIYIPHTEATQKYLHTTYKNIEAIEVNPLTIKW